MQGGGAVLDGRDIGTVIAPDADVKLFITASVQARARRRWLEMTAGDIGREIDIPLAEIERDIVARDDRDLSRKDAPLRAAAHALVFDTKRMHRSRYLAEAITALRTSQASAPQKRGTPNAPFI